MTYGTIAVGSKGLLAECMDMHHMLMLAETSAYYRHMLCCFLNQCT